MLGASSRKRLHALSKHKLDLYPAQHGTKSLAGGSGAARRLAAHSSSKLESEENVAGKVPLSVFTDKSLHALISARTNMTLQYAKECVLHRPPASLTMRERYESAMDKVHW